MSWYRRNEELYKQEAKVWKKYGFALSQEGIEKEETVIFKGTIPFEGEPYEFQVFYPEGYPFLAPSVKCLSLKEAKHQTPRYHTVCWHEDWKDYGIVKAETVYHRMTKWLEGAKKGFRKEDESNHQDPPFYHLSSFREATLLAPKEVYENWEGKIGIFTINAVVRSKVMRAQLMSIKPKLNYYKKIEFVQEFLESERTKTFEVEGKSFYKNGKEYQGICVNVTKEPPFFENGEELRTWLEKHTPHLDKGWMDFEEKEHSNGYDFGDLIGIRYPKNGKHQFLVVSLEKDMVNDSQSFLITNPMIVFQSEPLSEEVLFSRVSHLQGLKGKHVAIIGVGAMGSPIAVELAKAGVGKLTFIDPDVVKPGNVVRHSANLNHVGMPKVMATGIVCREHNPYVDLNGYRIYFGHLAESGIEGKLGGVDLFIGAIGHSPTERYLDNVARRMNIPVVYAYANAGAAGGRIFSVDPAVKGCYHCHQYAIEKGEVPALVKGMQQGEIHEDGCASPAYLGSGIDISSIALFAARLALQLLLKDQPDAYERATYNHLVVQNQTGMGFPTSSVHTVEADEQCPYCHIEAVETEGYYPKEAVALVDAITDYEEYVFEVRNWQVKESEDKKAALEEAYQREVNQFIGKPYLSAEGQEFVFEGVFLNEEASPKEWRVSVKETSTGEVEEISLDTFFGYQLTEEGYMRRYQEKEVLKK